MLAFSGAFALGMLVLFDRLIQPLALLFLGILVGQALTPPIGWLSRWLPRAIAIILIYLALALIAAAVLWLVVPSLYVQVTQFFHDIPHLIDRGRTLLNHLAPGHGSQIASSLKNPALQASKQLLSLPLTLASTALKFVIVIFFSIYWLLTAPALYRFALSLTPEARRHDAAALFNELGNMLGGYIRGDVLDAILIGTIAYIGMLVLGVRFALVIGLITTLGDLIPLVGSTVAQFAAAGIALTESPLKGLITLAFFLVLQQIDGNITLPTITRGVARIPPLLLVFALVAGGTTGGVLGAIIAIPLAGAVRILVVRVAAPLIRHWLGIGGQGKGQDGG